jgi:cell division protein FtsW
MNFARTDTSLIGRWWWTVDRLALASIAALIAVGVVLALAAGPPVAARLGAEDSFVFVKRQLMLLPVALAFLLGGSLLSPRAVRRLGAFLLLAALVLLALTPIFGTEIKGARRWLSIGGSSVQPAELVKPAFIVMTAWLLALARRHPQFPGLGLSGLLVAVVIGLLMAQPDLGQSVIVGTIWLGQLFLGGLPLWTVPAFGLCAALGLGGAYFALPHVTSRIDRFLDPAAGDNYQIDRSLEAFVQGGLFGRGPGDGVVKHALPDAHADFVFAVAGEELGLLACLGIVILFAFFVLRSFGRLLQEESLFVTLATAGLVAEFGLQALINMSSSLALIPTKGMTLPFLSYGGSSLLAISLSTGFILALTRRRAGPAEEP